MSDLPQLLIGRELSEESLEHRWTRMPVARQEFGRVAQSTIQSHRGSDLTYAGHNHLLTIAGTGAGKGRSVIIPNLAQYPGPVVVFDPKGENYAVTARRRRQLGHQVWKIDPFNLMDRTSDRLNPFDIFSLQRETTEAGAITLANLFPDYSLSATLSHHYQLAQDLIAGLIAHVAADLPKEEQSLCTVWRLLSAPAAQSQLHVLVEEERSRPINDMAWVQINAFLDLPENDLRAIVWNTARRLVDILHISTVRESLGPSSFNIQDIVDGKPLSIYLIIPPDKLKRYSALLRLWLGSLMKAILSRTKPPASKSLFFLDECGKFGAFQILEDAITVGRGYGMQVWTFWQDLSQIKALFPTSWQTIVANCDVLQVFGPRNQMVSSDFQNMLGTGEDEVRRLRLCDQITKMMGGDPVRSTRPDYLWDAEFKDYCDENPFYGPFKPADFEDER